MQNKEDNYRSCVGIMLMNKDGNVFIGQRNDTITEAWQMPQGGIEPGEEPKDAALRELYEETGVSADKVDFVKISDGWLYYDYPADVSHLKYFNRHKGQKQKWALFSFFGEEKDVKLDVYEQEFSAWRWAKPSEVLNLIVDFKKPVYEKAFKELLG